MRAHRLTRSAVAALLMLSVVSPFQALAESPTAEGPKNVTLTVPFRSQVDGTIWAASNCGPTSLAMLLETFGNKISTTNIRKRANQLMKVSNPDSGTRIQDLSVIAEEYGLAVHGPMKGSDFRRWGIDEVRDEIRIGRPVLIETRLALLPNQKGGDPTSDHFIVLTGTEGTDFFYNDPADSKHPGYRLKMTEAQMVKAWAGAKRPLLAFSVGPGSIGHVQPAMSTLGNGVAEVMALTAPDVMAETAPVETRESIRLTIEKMPRSLVAGSLEETHSEQEATAADVAVPAESWSLLTRFFGLFSFLRL